LMTTTKDPEAAPAETRKVDTFSYRAVIGLHTAAITFFVLWNVVGHRKYYVLPRHPVFDSFCLWPEHSRHSQIGRTPSSWNTVWET
jgi:hypothetical protein